MKINEKYVRQWTVPSSSGGGDYIISECVDGAFECGCRGWTGHYPRTDCRHIREVKAGGGIPLEEAIMQRMVGG